MRIPPAAPGCDPSGDHGDPTTCGNRRRTISYPPAVHLRILGWAVVLGVAGGAGGIVVADTVRPDVFTAPGWGMVIGSVVGASLGATFAVLTNPRRHRS
jgi:hypothetical protein